MSSPDSFSIRASGRSGKCSSDFGFIAFRVGGHHGSLAGLANQKVAKQRLLRLPCPLGFAFPFGQQSNRALPDFGFDDGGALTLVQFAFETYFAHVERV